MRTDVVFLVSVITSLGSIMLIVENAPTIIRGVLAFWVQVSHDSVCLMMPYAVGECLLTRKRPGGCLLLVNAAYTLIMACFAYHKRCVLTLWFNDLIMIDKCHRYIPLWQRIMNRTTDTYVIASTCDHRSAYLWLNDQILFSIMIMILNLDGYHRMHPSYLISNIPVKPLRVF